MIYNYIEGNVTDTVYIGELEIHTLLTDHCATYNVWPGPLIAQYLALTAKSLDAPSPILLFHSTKAATFFQRIIVCLKECCRLFVLW